jgi:DNA-binding CsgD family transcriptional regulator
LPQNLLERDSAAVALGATLNRAQGGKVAVTLVLGEAGLGKTALLEAAVGEASQSGFEVAHAQGAAAEVTLPFGYVSQLFPDEAAEDVLGFVTTLPPQERAAVAWQRLRGWALQRRRRPLLLALDDLHWADRDSLMLLGLLARQRGPARLALVGALRPWPGEAASLAETLVTTGEGEVVRLVPLSTAASFELVTRLAGSAVAEELAPRLDELCGGNPLLLSQLSSQAGSAPASGDGHGLLLSRFTGLDEEGLRYARAAAVSGVQFRPSVAAAVAGLMEPEAHRALDAMCRNGLVSAVEPGRAAFAHSLLRRALYDDLPEPLKTELHASTFRQLADQRAPAGEVATHALAARLRTKPALRAVEEAGFESLSQGALQAAVKWFTAAAELGGSECPASAHLHLAEALDGTGAPDKAADVCSALLNGRRDLGTDLAARVERLLGRALFEMGRGDEAEEAFRRAASLTVQEEPNLALEILLEASLVSLYGSGVRRSFEFAEQAERLLSPTTDRQLAAWVRAAWGHARSLMAEPGGVDEVDRAVASLPPGTGLRGLHGAAAWGPRLVQLQTAKQAERFDEAVRAYQLAMEEAASSPVRLSTSIYSVAHADTVARLGRVSESRDILLAADEDSPYLAARRPWVQVGLAYTSYQLADFAQAASHCQQVEAAIGAEADTLPLLRFWLWYVRCGLHLSAGAIGAATELARRAEVVSEKAGVIEPCFPWHSAAIDAYLAAGRPADATRCVERLEQLCLKVPCLWPRTVAARGRAELAFLAGDHEAAGLWFERALGWQRELPMPLVKAETLTRYGVFLRRTRAATKARQLLGEAVRTAAACGARRLELVATEELHLAGGRRRTSPHRAGPHRGAPAEDARDCLSLLTPAQWRVAELAASGLTNKEIGRRLFISGRTVEHHLGAIYLALGITGRRYLSQRLAALGPRPNRPPA